MARDPLPVLLRVRSIALDDARRRLAERLREEAAAAERCVGIAATIAQENGLQASQPVEGRSVDAHAAWLGGILATQRDAAAAVRACATAAAEALTSLSAARTDARALEVMVQRVQDARRATAARVEQAALDEAAAGCKRPERWSG